MILKCTCLSKFQDKEYGRKMRMCNNTETDCKYRCTVCGTLIVGPLKGKKK